MFQAQPVPGSATKATSVVIQEVTESSDLPVPADVVMDTAEDVEVPAETLPEADKRSNTTVIDDKVC